MAIFHCCLKIVLKLYFSNPCPKLSPKQTNNAAIPNNNYVPRPLDADVTNDTKDRDNANITNDIFQEDEHTPTNELSIQANTNPLPSHSAQRQAPNKIITLHNQ